MDIRKLALLDNLRLNLGCGDKILSGFLNVDIIEKKGVIKIDLNHYPLPFKDNSCRYVLLSHVLEHLEDPTNFLLELYRICKAEAVVDIYVPHFSLCATYADLTHKRPGFSYLTFGNPKWNSEINKKFKTISKKIYFTRDNMKLLNYVFNPIINAFPIFYERFWAFIFPCSQIHFRLKAVKSV